MFYFWLFLIIFLILCYFSSKECPANSRKRFTSDDAVIKSVKAESSSSSWPVTNFLSSVLKAVWCAYDYSSSFEGNNVNVTFTAPVVLDVIMSEGYLFSNSPAYVSQATVYYTASSNESMQLLKVIRNTYVQHANAFNMIPYKDRIFTNILKSIIA